MRNGPENPISPKEHFLIRNVVEPTRPIMANVTVVRDMENEDGVWQKVGLKRVVSPQSSLEMRTYRRLACGVYTNRDNRFTFLRFSVLQFEDMSKFFDMDARQLIKTLTEDIFRISPSYEVNQVVMSVQARHIFDPGKIKTRSLS